MSKSVVCLCPLAFGHDTIVMVLSDEKSCWC